MKKPGALACVLIIGCGGGSKKPTPTPPTGGGGPDTSSPTPKPASEPSTTKPSEAPSKAKSLYDRLGGKPAVEAVVAEFVARTTTDDRIKDRFFNVDADNLKKLLAEFVCSAGGGGCQYEGRDMATAHAGMDLVDDEFTALVEDLVGALDKFKVPEKEKGELLGALGPLKPQIVAPADKLHPIDDKKLEPVTKLAAGLKDKEAQRLLGLAVTAGKRGQRSYAEQLFTRAEMLAGAKAVAAGAKVFRSGAPERITTATHVMKDAGAQPAVVGKDDEAEAPKPAAKAKIGMLHGSIKIDGKAPSGLGIVTLYPAKGGFAKRTAKQRVIEQRNKEFAPHVMAVPVGSTVSFPNFDGIFHNVFSLSKAKAFDLGMYKSGETRDVKFEKPGIIRLGCNLHANMSAYIVVVDAPHYVVVDADGTYSFKALAPGKYKVAAWHEPSGEPSVTEVEVKEGDNTQDLDLKAGQGGLGTNKFGDAR
jgi:hemoglobin